MGRYESNQKYKREKLARFGFDTHPEILQVFRECAEKEGMPFTTWVKKTLAARCEEVGLEVPKHERKRKNEKGKGATTSTSD